MAARAKIVLLCSEGHSVASVAEMTGTTRPTVYQWVDRYEREGVDGLVDRPRPGREPQISERVRARIVALTKQTPPESTGLSHGSSRELATYLRREEGITVSYHVVADRWREHGLTPHRSGTFKLSKDPNVAVRMMDVVGLYWPPPARCCGALARRKDAGPGLGPDAAGAADGLRED